MHLIVGSTGMLGSQICRRLRERGEPVRALVRATSDQAQVADLRSLGAEIFEGDLADPASLRAAAAGASSVTTTATATRPSRPSDEIETTDGEGTAALIEAAEAAGVRRFVYVSVTPGLGTDNPLGRAKRAAEARLAASGLEHTILRPSFFMDAWLSPVLGFNHPQGEVVVFGSGDRPVSWIHSRDVAEVAARAAAEGIAGRRTLDLGGPEALSPDRVVEIFEQAAGASFEVQRVPEQALEDEAGHAEGSLAQTFAALKLLYARGDVIPMAGLAEELGVELCSVAEYARQVSD